MEIRQLRYFISAATHLNFTRAARECFIVQTAMTQQIANLESEIGVRLFERGYRSLTLTPAGEVFLRDAREIVARAQAAGERARSFEEGYANLLRIGYHGEMVKEDLVRLLRQLRQEGARWKPLLCQKPQTELLDSLRDGVLDFIITLYGAFFEAEDWLEWEVLEEDRLMLAVSRDHPLAGRESVTMAEVEEQPLVNFDEKNNEERTIELARSGRHPREYCRVEDHTSGEILIRSGWGAAIWVSRLCRPGLYPELAFLPITDHPGRERLVLAWRKGGLDPDQQALKDRLAAMLRAGAEGIVKK